MSTTTRIIGQELCYPLLVYPARKHNPARRTEFVFVLVEPIRGFRFLAFIYGEEGGVGISTCSLERDSSASRADRIEFFLEQSRESLLEG